MRRVLLPLILTAIVLLACSWAFVYVQSGWPTAPLKRTPEQPEGGNAAQDTSPAAGVKKNPQDSNKTPGNQ
ncbi:MAG: hypothetical protein EOS40_19325 [Mesorhizobium sp.]|nr:MAG: hypothetical protein EOS40_19325 [Mesorhizobium sp.]